MPASINFFSQIVILSGGGRKRNCSKDSLLRDHKRRYAPSTQSATLHLRDAEKWKQLLPRRVFTHDAAAQHSANNGEWVNEPLVCVESPGLLRFCVNHTAQKVHAPTFFFFSERKGSLNTKPCQFRVLRYFGPESKRWFEQAFSAVNLLLFESLLSFAVEGRARQTGTTVWYVPQLRDSAAGGKYGAQSIKGLWERILSSSSIPVQACAFNGGVVVRQQKEREPGRPMLAQWKIFFFKFGFHHIRGLQSSTVPGEKVGIGKTGGVGGEGFVNGLRQMEKKSPLRKDFTSCRRE